MPNSIVVANPEKLPNCNRLQSETERLPRRLHPWFWWQAVLRHALAGAVHVTEVVLRPVVALFCGLAVPLRRLGIVLRHREAAKGALGEFMNGRTLSANQIEFIDLIIDHLMERGVMDPRRLYESPFTDLDDQGVSGLFPTADVKALVQVLHEVSARAAA